MLDNLKGKLNRYIHTNKIIKSTFTILFFFYSAYLQLIPIYLFHIKRGNITNQMQVYLSTFSSVVVAVVFLVMYYPDLKKEFHHYKKNFIECMDSGVRWWLLGLFIMFASNLFITFVLHGGGANNEKTVQSMLDSVPLIMFLDAGILAPFNEEIVFRKSFRDVIKNKWVFALLSFLVFGGAHVIFDASSFVDFLYIIPYGALGGVFALAYDETNTIFTSLSMHMIHNTILVLLSIFVL